MIDIIRKCLELGKAENRKTPDLQNSSFLPGERRLVLLLAYGHQTIPRYNVGLFTCLCDSFRSKCLLAYFNDLSGRCQFSFGFNFQPINSQWNNTKWLLFKIPLNICWDMRAGMNDLCSMPTRHNIHSFTFIKITQHTVIFFNPTCEKNLSAFERDLFFVCNGWLSVACYIRCFLF